MFFVEFKNNKIYCKINFIIFKKNNKNKATDFYLNEKIKKLKKIL